VPIFIAIFIAKKATFLNKSFFRVVPPLQKNKNNFQTPKIRIHTLRFWIFYSPILDILQPDFGYFEALVSEPRQK
jgi:hypothetical protein